MGDWHGVRVKRCSSEMKIILVITIMRLQAFLSLDLLNGLSMHTISLEQPSAWSHTTLVVLLLVHGTLMTLACLTMSSLVSGKDALLTKLSNINLNNRSIMHTKNFISL